ncbi:MAG TPA: ABC transporter ATP-binding protein, partial [Alphaproteobacteria bacterium]|nr:ABC transporter ATP-binding protein [Alphaproteobacteria bacterium]
MEARSILTSRNYGKMAANGGALLKVNNVEVIYDHVILVLKGV